MKVFVSKLPTENRYLNRVKRNKLTTFNLDVWLQKRHFFQIETYAQIGSHIPFFSNSALVIVSVSVVAFSSFSSLGESNDTASDWFTWFFLF
jgi:hypothetical protein